MTIAFAPGDLVRARGREWVAVPSPRAGLLALRPLTGAENDVVVLDPRLESLPVEAARFNLPQDAAPTVQTKAALLADALRMTLRRGAGPFRSAAQLAFTPRIYQLVPLLMALRLQTPRLLIADDVGVGKTIEAGLILREFIDRGEVEAFSILCPPHLVEQWTQELKERFGIEAVGVTAGSAPRLERGLPLAQTLFEAYPHTVVSLDYIKAEKRRDGFARHCPDFVIVDEAHACVGVHKGRQQRFELLRGLAGDPGRRMLLLTATPHSGDEEAFARLLSLIDPAFGSMAFDESRYRERLARHFVQRRRIDLVSAEWDEDRAFPRHETTENPYRLSKSHLDFHEAVLDYCFAVVERAGSGARERRLAFWGTLALMRCVGSSPAAALSALRNRLANEAGDKLEPQIYDDDGDDEDAVDLEPGTFADGDPALQGLMRQAEELVRTSDPKLDALVGTLAPLLKQGANPVVFCRYLATADHVRDGLRRAFPKLRIESVTGVLTPDERRDRVAEMAGEDEDKPVQRLLVATDCLSEGINLQQLFDTVVHYDLSWNPTRHQQREGRVNRFGQPAPLVRSIMMFSPDSAIDGAVLDVIIRKAEEIREATGVTVPLPEERGPVTDALLASMMLRRGQTRQLAFDLRVADGLQAMETRWRDAAENERKSRARFAQNAIKPQEVAPEWEKAAALLGSPDAARTFVERAMARFGAALEPRKSNVLLAHVHALAPALRERLQERGIVGSVRLALTEPAPAGAAVLSRTHPLTSTIAEALVEASLDPESLVDLGLGRVGAWPTPAVNRLTRIAVLRIRYKLTVHARRERLLLAEEAALVALQGGAVAAAGEAARLLLETPAATDLANVARDRLVGSAKADLPGMLEGPIAEYVRERAAELAEDHDRLRAAGAGSRVSVEAVEPPDVIGLFVLSPSEG